MSGVTPAPDPAPRPPMRIVSKLSADERIDRAVADRAEAEKRLVEQRIAIDGERAKLIGEIGGYVSGVKGMTESGAVAIAEARALHADLTATAKAAVEKTAAATEPLTARLESFAAAHTAQGMDIKALSATTEKLTSAVTALMVRTETEGRATRDDGAATRAMFAALAGAIGTLGAELAEIKRIATSRKSFEFKNGDKIIKGNFGPDPAA